MRAGRARPLAHSFSFSNMARGRGRRWRRPGRAFLAWPPPREPRAGRRGGAGACVRAWLDVRGSGWPSRASAPRGRWRRVEPSEVGGCPRGASGRGPRGVRVAGAGRLAPRWGCKWRCLRHPTPSGLVREALRAPGGVEVRGSFPHRV